MILTAYASNGSPGILQALDKIFPGGIANIFNFSLQIGLLLAFGVIVYAGILYMTAGDDASKVKNAKEWIQAAFTGLFIIASAYALLSIVNPKLTTLKEVTIPKAPAYLTKSASIAVPAGSITAAPAELASLFPGINELVPSGGYLSNVIGLRGQAGYSCETHTGLDITGYGDGTIPAPIKAPADGNAEYFADAIGYGNMVKINHGNGFISIYGHLSNNKFQEFASLYQNKRVTVGTTIGYVGNTGRSTGLHLHFEIRRGETEILKINELTSQFGNGKDFLEKQVACSSCSEERKNEYHANDGIRLNVTPSDLGVVKCSNY